MASVLLTFGTRHSLPWGHLGPCRMLSGVPDLHPLEARSILPVVTIKNVSRHCCTSPAGRRAGRMSLVENCCSGLLLGFNPKNRRGQSICVHPAFGKLRCLFAQVMISLRLCSQLFIKGQERLIKSMTKLLWMTALPQKQRNQMFYRTKEEEKKEQLSTLFNSYFYWRCLSSSMKLKY